MKVYKYNNEFFYTLATYIDGETEKQSFGSLASAMRWRDNLMKEADIKDVEILELISTAVK